MGRRRDRDAADRGDDDAAAGEPDRDPLRHRAARPTASSSRTSAPTTARHGRGAGPVAEEWDVQAGTALRRSRPPTGGSRCATRGRTRATATWCCGPTHLVGPPRTVDRRTAPRAPSTTRRSPAPSGGPRHPGVLVSGDGSTALLSSRDGPLLLLDLATDAVAGPGPFTQPPSCEPLGPLVADRGGRRLRLVGAGQHLRRPRRSAPPRHARRGEHPLARRWSGRPPASPSCRWTTSAPGRWRRSRPTVTSRRSRCRRPRPAWSPTWPSAARCTSAAAAARATAADSSPTTSASGRVTDLAGPGAGGRTVRQAFVLTTPS